MITSQITLSFDLAFFFQMSCCEGEIGNDLTITIDGNPSWQYGMKGDHLVCDDDMVAIGMCTRHPGNTGRRCPNLYT